MVAPDCKSGLLNWGARSSILCCGTQKKEISMPGMFTNPRKQGDIGEMAAMLYYAKQGYEVFCPMTESSRADLIVVKENRMVRVQCKTSTVKKDNGTYVVGLATGGGNQSWNRVSKRLSSDEIDEVFIWCDNDSTWLFPIEVLEGKRTVNLSAEKAECHIGGPIPANKEKARSVGVCKICGLDTNTRKQTYCDEHRPKSKTKIDWPDDETLRAMLAESNYTKVGLKLGVSDNAIRKRLSR